jgi:hypothetical protein
MGCIYFDVPERVVQRRIRQELLHKLLKHSNWCILGTGPKAGVIVNYADIGIAIVPPLMITIIFCKELYALPQKVRNASNPRSTCESTKHPHLC